MADDVQRRVIYLEVNSSKAIDGSAAATRALAAVGQSATSAGAAMEAFQTATSVAGGSAQKTALELAITATAAANLGAASRTTTGTVLELARASATSATSAQAQAAAFARLADQRTMQASLAETRALMDGVSRSSANLTHMYGAQTVAVTALATAQTQAAGMARLAQQTMIEASRARSQATMGAVDSFSPDAAMAYYYGSGRAGPAALATAATPAAAARTPMTAQQRLMLGYQFNDVFTSLASGMNPAMIAAQQGPQITQVFGGIGNTLSAIPRPALIAGGAAVGAAGILATVAAMKSMSDAADEQRRRLGALLGDQQLAATAYDAITRQAIATGKAITDVSASFSKFSTATANLGATIPQVMALTSASGQLGRIGGSTPEETAAGADAIAKALAQSIVSADSLQAIFDTMPVAARRIADGIGVSTSQLKLMAQQGDLTNRQVFASLLGQVDKIKSDFNELPGTIGAVFSGLIIQAEDFATRLYKAVKNFEILTDRSQQFGGKAALTFPGTGSNLNAPSGALPTFAPKFGPKVDGAGIESDLAAGATASIAVSKALADAADSAVRAGAKIAAAMDPATAELKSLEDQAVAVTKAIDSLAAADYDDATKVAQLKKLSAAMDELRQKSLDAGGAYLQAVRAAQDAQTNTELGRTPGQTSYAQRVADAMKGPNGAPTAAAAQTLVDAQQVNLVDQMIQKQQQQLVLQQGLTAAMRNGKAAAGDQAAAMTVLGISFDQLGNITPELKKKLEELTQIFKDINAQGRAQASIDASKPLVTELAAITAAQAVYTQGVYAMKRAEAEARAARDENGTGQLQMDIFDQRQALDDATALHNLGRQIDLTKELTAAAGDLAQQKQIQLDYDIKTAQLAASPAAHDTIALGMRLKFQADINREAKEGLADLQRQNELAQQQLDIIRTGAPDMAAQLAMLQKRYDLVSKGAPLDQAQVDAAGANARLQEQLTYAKDAAEGTKRIWKNAYDNIQSGAADTFYDIFNGAGFNAQSAAEAMKKIFLRTFAEIAAAAIIRPLITPIFQLGESAGIIPAGVVPSATGIPGGGGSASSSGGGLFGGSGFSMPSLGGGGIGGLFGSSFMQRPIFGGGIDSEIANWSTYGTAAQGGSGLFSSSATFGQAFGGAAGALGIGLGINSLIHARSAGSAIGGAAGILGGGLGLASAIFPALGATLGPIGIGVGLLGAILPSLLGGDAPKTPPQPPLVFSGGAFNGSGTGYSYEGGSVGAGSPLTSDARTIAGNLQKAFRAAGLSTVSGKLIGGGLGVGVDHTLNGDQWADSPYTSTELRLADGTREGLNYNDSRTPEQASEFLTAQVFKANVLRGGVSGAGAGLKAGLETINPTTAKDLDRVVSLGTAYDKLGKTLNPAKDAIDKLSASFDDLKQFATDAGLSLGPINEELKKQSTRSAQDFIDAILDPLAVQTRALDDDRAAALESARYIKDNITGVYVDLDKITAAYGKKRLALEDQFYGGAISNLEDLIARLTYGDLGNASPLLHLAGSKAAYENAVSGARDGDATAIANLSGYAETYAGAAQQSFASGPQYEAIRHQILVDLQERDKALGGGASAPSTTAIAQQVVQMTKLAVTADQQRAEDRSDTAALKRQMQDLIDLMGRLVSNRAA